MDIMNMIEVRRLLAQAVKENIKFEQYAPGGRGAYDFSYDPGYQLEVSGHTMRLYDSWCGESENSGYCYRLHLSVDCDREDYSEFGFCCRVSRLDGVSQKLLDRIQFKSDAELEAELLAEVQ